MPTVSEQFAQALRTRLDGRFEEAFGEGAGVTLAAARQADLEPEVLAAAVAEDPRAHGCHAFACESMAPERTTPPTAHA